MAAQRLGTWCEQGPIDARDYRAPATRHLVAAERGDAMAQLPLGRLHEDGRGVPQSAGPRNARAQRMSAEALAEARTRVEEWWQASQVKRLRP